MADLFENNGAALTHDRRYRLRLWRQWDGSRGLVNWIMLNPSTADEEADDPTIRRCIGYARRWGFGGIVVTNLFALRATDPRELRGAPDPIGPDNDVELVAVAFAADLVVCAWGNVGRYRHRARQVVKLLHGAPGVDLHCLRITDQGQPCHPLYLPADLDPIPYTAEELAHG